MREDTSLGGPNAGFRTTLWTVVRGAQEGSREALGVLIAAYRLLP
jgi:hypothetical protein